VKSRRPHPDLVTQVTSHEILETMIIEKTGWTFNQLDEADYGRLMRKVAVWGVKAEVEAEASRAGRGAGSSAGDE